ncbi:MAG TPA: glycosyltransferase family 4 protein [Solirubrobacteraceae bacterium]|jgi:glycosyltransferase involved in cell wall biosynthesis|nr:glycosyltransferase family 4 protein [Solirubrobacteraceae bacterium]
MRVALVSRFAWPHLGGTEVLVRTAANGLAVKHDVEVFAHRVDDAGTAWRGPLDRSEPFGPLQDPASGVRISQLRMTRGDLVALAPFLAVPRRGAGKIGLLRRPSAAVEPWHARVAGRRFARTLDGADVIHRFGGNRMALATVRAARLNGRPVAVTPLAHPGQWDDDPISARAYREADLVVATGDADADTYSGLGVAADRLRVCPLPTRAPSRGGGERLRDQGTVSGPLILFLGVRRAHKGIDALLGAASILHEQEPAAQVAFVGPGPALPASAPANAMDVGEVDDETRDAWLDAASIVCLPSSNESWGLAISEAWSVGAPVVTSDIPILRRRVQEVGGGLAVPPRPRELAAALLALLRDDTRRREMGRAGQEHYERALSETAFAAWHEEAYRRLLERAPATTGG